MNTIPIHWAQGHRGNWDHGMLMLAEEGKLVRGGGMPKFKRVDTTAPGTVVVVVGKRWNEPGFQDWLASLRDCLVVSTSDEDSLLDPGIIHPSNKFWVQYGKPGKHDKADKWILAGMRYETPLVVRDQYMRITTLVRIPPSPRQYLWSFTGQLQNRSRKEMAEALRDRADGLLRITEGFGGLQKDGVEYGEYIRTMLRSDFVLCPEGNVSADTIRFSEALECGAIPVVNSQVESEPVKHCYWERVFGHHIEELPLICFLVPAFAEWLLILKRNEEQTSARREQCCDFWRGYKRRFVLDIAASVEQLRR